jgi:hypothetical protein
LVTRDRNAIGCSAFNIPWKQFSLPLLHPPLSILPRVLRRIRQEGIAAIVIAPAWQRQPWSAYLAPMTIRSQILGSADQVLIRGKRMAEAKAELPPGDIGVYLVDTKMTKANSI